MTTHLMHEAVGPTGHVVGVDIGPSIIGVFKCIVRMSKCILQTWDCDQVDRSRACLHTQ
jgi:hypothetical protein